MQAVTLEHEVDFDGWRRAARAMAVAGVAPEGVIWAVRESADLFAERAEVPVVGGGFSVSRALVELAETTIQARDPERFALLYGLIWRAHRGEKHLLEDVADPLVQRVTRLAQAVRRDAHKMRAFVRFRDVLEDGVTRHLAWFEPDHYIVEANAPFFVRRFATMTWSILTPYRSAHWDGETLRLGAGATKAEVPDDRGAAPDASAEGIAALAAEAAGCRLCDLYRHATQTVFGEGPADARVMLVGEQPGDQEDLAGRPFVGPAGQMLNRALIEAGIARETVYVTNAVKHFKFEPRGKRRMHVTPNASEIEICRFWLDQERALLKPAVIVLLGASAARAVLGRAVTISRDRARGCRRHGHHAPVVFVTPTRRRKSAARIRRDGARFARGAGAGGVEERKYFFFEKKKQKTFIHCSQQRGQTTNTGAAGNRQKFFGSFFQKRTASFLNAKVPLSYHPAPRAS
jgi:uracil-DNA glycosylase